MTTQGISGSNDYSVLAAAHNLANLRKNWIKKVDENGDGKIDSTELAKAHGLNTRKAESVVKEYDIDGDGVLSEKEADSLAKANQMAALHEAIGKLIDKEDAEGIKKLFVLFEKENSSTDLPILLKTNSAVTDAGEEQEAITDLASVLGQDYYDQLKEAFTNELGTDEDESLSSILDITV